MHFLREKEYFSRAWQLFGTRSFLEIATDYILIDYILCLKGGDQLTPFFFHFPYRNSLAASKACRRAASIYRLGCKLGNCSQRIISKV